MKLLNQKSISQYDESIFFNDYWIRTNVFKFEYSLIVCELTNEYNLANVFIDNEKIFISPVCII